MTLHSFKDLDAWQQGHKVTLAIYKASKSFPHTEQFGLTNQMRRAAISITSNIAEGFGRQTGKDKAHFYTIAKGSLLEVQSQLQVAFDLEYTDKKTYGAIDSMIIQALQVTHGLIRSASTR
jgi:four helix bundle protein